MIFIGLLIGLIIGTFFGMMIMALMSVASKESRRRDNDTL